MQKKTNQTKFLSCVHDIFACSKINGEQKFLNNKMALWFKYRCSNIFTTRKMAIYVYIVKHKIDIKNKH